MYGFANVSNMSSRQIQRMGHNDDPTTYRARTNTKKVVLNLNADDVWAAACQAQRTNGAYVKLSVLTEDDKSQNKLSNRQIVESLLVDTTLITDQSREEGKKVRAFYQAFTFKILQGKQLSEFDNNAMLIANREVITGTYDLAVIASLPSCYERGVKRQTVDQRVNFATGGLIGTVGKKVSTSIEVLRSVFSQTYNVNFVTGINSDDQVVFFAYKKELEVGKMYDIYGTVKGHRDNTTQLNRVKVIV
jgi:catabolite regulation protein CreA